MHGLTQRSSLLRLLAQANGPCGHDLHQHGLKQHEGNTGVPKQVYAGLYSKDVRGWWGHLGVPILDFPRIISREASVLWALEFYLMLKTEPQVLHIFRACLDIGDPQAHGNLGNPLSRRCNQDRLPPQA